MYQVANKYRDWIVGSFKLQSFPLMKKIELRDMKET